MRNILIICMLTLVLSGCHVISHDEDRAVADANIVLKILYFDEDYQKAFDNFPLDFREKYKPDNLKQIVDMMKSKKGDLKELQIDSFLPMPGQKAITLFYNGINEEGLTYHRVVLSGDANGYTVAGVFVNGVPYPENKLRQKFNKTIIVKR